VEYKYWIERKTPYANVEDEVASLCMQGSDFRRLIDPTGNEPIDRLGLFLKNFDMSTVYPLLLHLLMRNLPLSEWAQISTDIESYILRRAVMGWPTNNYTRIFLQLIRIAQDGVSPAAAIRAFLSGLSGETMGWPDDQAFASRWETAHVYQTLQNARVVYILRRLGDSFRSGKSEDITINSPLTVEHILPQNWIANWPLPDGSPGLTGTELWDADPSTPRALATRRRNALVQTFGNLTIVTQGLNSAASNSGWDRKKDELARWSLLPINRDLAQNDEWSDGSIETRGRALFLQAQKLWPGPDQAAASSSVLEKPVEEVPTAGLSNTSSQVSGAAST
jgi:hypothetical protein